MRTAYRGTPGANVQLGPGMCLARIPRNGRNFEYISGEDPHRNTNPLDPTLTLKNRTWATLPLRP